ncbi:MAG TPA: 3-phosphoserine/phosphohydroxythreonine transaminase [Gammaproteobacteria bacterium]|nr:3-phosphoserine/phosphohydroxythreonine transaminase [Gammaproteobacteria bacterium]
MGHVYNFSAGPAALPREVMQRAREEFLDVNGTGLAALEMSHRSKSFIAIAEQAEADLRELMNIPANYKVLFLQGGATMQFGMIPLNLLQGKNKADYFLTGHWSARAVDDARRLCEVNLAVDASDNGFTRLPPSGEWRLDGDAAYVHYTPNETIHGLEFHEIPETGGVPLVADMSSNILSRPVDVTRFGLIYAGAQKNIGPSGLTVVIVREDLLKGIPAGYPSMLDYALHAQAGSMYNTPPTLAWYLAGLVFDWLKRQGGVAAIEQVNIRKAAKLYEYIDGSGFYSNPVEKPYRSRMNVPFRIADESLHAKFVQEAEAAGLRNLEGHRAVGGMRASIYNAMPEEGVDALIEFMREFARRHG